MPSTTSLPITGVASPAEAVVRLLRANSFATAGGEAVNAGHIQLVEVVATPTALVDMAWSWRLHESAPAVYDVTGLGLVREAGATSVRVATLAEHPRILRGVVGWLESYDGYVTAADGGEDESDEVLLEYCVSRLG